MKSNQEPEDSYSDAIRKKYLYREMIQRGKVPLKYRSASRLIGPDCAYHLYGQYSARSLDEQNREEQ